MIFFESMMSEPIRYSYEGSWMRQKYFLQTLANGVRTPHISGIEFDLGRSAVSLGVPPFSHG
jgi:hypothetical protein